MPNPYGGVFKPHRSSTVLVLGILGFVVCFICGIVAWSMGNADLREMDAGIMDPSGRSQTETGRTVGMVSTIIGGIAIVFGGLFFLLAAARVWR